MKKYSKLIAAVFFAVVFVGTFVFLYLKSQPEPVTYAEVKPVVGDISLTTIVTGKIEPRNEVNIKPQISGIITDIYKEAGAFVKEGEVIAKVKVIPDMNSLSSAESRVRLAQINLNQAMTNFRRVKDLHEKKLVSDEEYEKLQQAMLQAREEKDAAEDALQVVRDGVSKSNANASSTLVRSTISGVILDIPVKVGNSVILSNTFNDGTTIATVANMSDLIFRGNIDETEVGRLTEGMDMKITIGALQNLKFDASLEYISPKATVVNGANQFEIKAAVSVNGTDKIRSGYSANAAIVLDRVEKVLTLPESVISFEGDSVFVYVVNAADEYGYERRSVTTGLSDGVNIEIKSGLKPDEMVRGAQTAGEDM